MESGAATSTSELEGLDAATSVFPNLSHTRLACCSVNGTVSTYAKEGAGWRLLADWRLPHGAAVKVVWAHPEHGAVLAVLADTGAVTLFSECQLQGEASMQLAATLVTQHVTALEFGPKELGLQLATASSNGTARVHQAVRSSCSEQWVPQTEFEGSTSSPCTALCWRSYSRALSPMLLLGTLEGAKVFCFDGQLMSWELVAKVGEEAVDDVSWSTTANGDVEYIACAQGSKVHVWQLEGQVDNLQTKEVATLEHKSSVCHIEWSPLGTWLAVATQAGDVNLWRPNLVGEWENQSKVEPQELDNDYVMVEAR